MISISITSLLQTYLADEYVPDWCMAMVISKEGSSYRTPGAMMLINPDGEAMGMVSGGCLEADVVRRSRQVLNNSTPRYIEYDMIDDESFAAELGIGCRGKIGVFVQPLTVECHHMLTLLLHELELGRACYLQQHYDSAKESQSSSMVLMDSASRPIAKIGDDFKLSQFNNEQQHNFVRKGDLCWSMTRFQPAIHLAVFGGGVDARPLVAMASILGWKISVIDQRPAYASHRFFPRANALIKKAPDSLVRECLEIDAAVVMTHNMKLDADWIQWLFAVENLPEYIGLLGPYERKQRVLDLLPECERARLERHIRGPVGMDLGGELPESIALAILADMHAVLNNGSGQQLAGLNKSSLSQVNLS